MWLWDLASFRIKIMYITLLDPIPLQRQEIDLSQNKFSCLTYRVHT